MMALVVAGEPRPPVLLVGMMGAGKSTVGPRLAAALGWVYLDSDAEIQRRTGRSVPEIWRAEGEAAYRVEEARVLADAVASPIPAVVAVAGGAVLDPANRELIAAAGSVIWLRARLATLAERVGDGAGRALLEPDPAAALARLDVARRPFYEALATVTVDVDELDPDEVAARVLAALPPCPSPGPPTRPLSSPNSAPPSPTRCGPGASLSCSVPSFAGYFVTIQVRHVVMGHATNTTSWVPARLQWSIGPAGWP